METPPTMVNTLTLTEAQGKIAEFRTKIQGAHWPLDIMKTKACFISQADLENMATLDITGMRCYLAIRYHERLGKNVVTLVMVGTRMLADGTHEDVLIDRNGNSAIFDFTTPCPDTCDQNSPLFTGL